MHPVERLRFVARSSGAPPEVLVRETASALMSFMHEPAALVTACRRVLSRQPSIGPLWWLCTRVLTAADPVAAARAAVTEIEDDRTVRGVVRALSDDAHVVLVGWQSMPATAVARRGGVSVRVVDVFDEADSLVRALEQADVDAASVPLTGVTAAVRDADAVLIEAAAVGPDRVVSIAGACAVAAVARVHGVPVWLVAGVGRPLNAETFAALSARLPVGQQAWDDDHDFVPLDLFDRCFGPDGECSSEALVARADPVSAPELFRADIT